MLERAPVEVAYCPTFKLLEGTLPLACLPSSSPSCFGPHPPHTLTATFAGFGGFQVSTPETKGPDFPPQQ